MKLKTLLVFVIGLVLLSVAAQAATSASAVSEMTDFFPEEALAATIKNVDDCGNLVVHSATILKIKGEKQNFFWRGMHEEA